MHKNFPAISYKPYAPLALPFDAFQSQQASLVREAAGKASQRAVGRNHAMAWHDERHRIAAHRQPDRARIPPPAHAPRDPSVGSDPSVGDPEACSPDPPLERRGEGQIHRNDQAPPAPRQKIHDLGPCALQERGRSIGSPDTGVTGTPAVLRRQSRRDGAFRPEREHDRRNAPRRRSHAHPSPACFENSTMPHGARQAHATSRPSLRLAMPHSTSSSSDRMRAWTPK